MGFLSGINLYFCMDLKSTNMRYISPLLGAFLFFIFSVNLWAQNPSDPILFTAGDQEVHLSEFEYIYKKNNGKKADYTRESLEEYLELYEKFKLKVQAARDMKLDTIEALNEELAGYRRQLAKSYLTDKEVLEGLSQELYERMKYDLRVAHIFFKVDKNQDTTEAYNKAWEVNERLKGGEKFESLVIEKSEDEFSKKKQGELGWVHAMLPNGFYHVESQLYSMEPGEVSSPVSSNRGYHILKLLDKRPARGEVEASHIFIRKLEKGKPDLAAKKQIESLYQRLQDGELFENLARLRSQDEATASKGGRIGRFGINRFENSFEDAVFALDEGDFSVPVESSLGWHIIKLDKHYTLREYNRERRLLQEKIRKDSRFEIAQEALIAGIKKSSGYKENRELLAELAQSVGPDFLSYKWTIPQELPQGTLFELGDERSSVKEFTRYLKSNTRDRLRMSKDMPIEQAVTDLFDRFVKLKAIQYEERNLEKKYPDFKALMREYEEGILLFEATKIEVWDKASEDTVGLKAFFNSNRDNYQWGPRALLVKYTITSPDQKLHEKIRKYAKKKGHKKALAKFNKKNVILKAETEWIEEKNWSEMSDLPFKKSAVSDIEVSEDLYMAKFSCVESIKPVSPKSLNEARGYIIADYQDQLEKEWIAELKKKYEVKLDEAVFKSMVRN